MSITFVGEDPELTAAIAKLDALLAAEGIVMDTADYGGVRTEPDTVKILAYREADYAVYVAAQKKAGRKPVPIEVFRPINQFGKSHHNYGDARDRKLKGYGVPGSGVTAAMNAKALERQAQIIGAHPELKLRAGWNFPRRDAPHVELAITLDEAKRRWLARVAGRGVQLGKIFLVGVMLYLAYRWWRRRRDNKRSSE